MAKCLVAFWLTAATFSPDRKVVRGEMRMQQPANYSA